MNHYSIAISMASVSDPTVQVIIANNLGAKHFPFETIGLQYDTFGNYPFLISESPFTFFSLLL